MEARIKEIMVAVFSADANEITESITQGVFGKLGLSETY